MMTKRKKKQHGNNKRRTAAAENHKKHNPLLQAQKQFLQTLTKNERDNFFSNTAVDPERRAEIWMDQADLGESLVNQYSWATPDERALRILERFSPIVEMGCGSNAYWCRCMAEKGIDVVGFDAQLQDGGKIVASNKDNDKKKSNKSGDDTTFGARQGGPEVLASKEIRDSKRTLFLCYPDENDTASEEQHDGDNDAVVPLSTGAACLEHYKGDYVIHVGELYGDTLSLDQAPWGRSSGFEFQQRLSSEYHCILKASLTSWLHVRDTISVWKRSERCSIVFAADEDDDDDEEEEVEYTHIPLNERMPMDMAAPCMDHLLTQDSEVRETNQPTSSQSPTNKEISNSGSNGGREKKRRKKGSKEAKAEAVSLESAAATADAAHICPW